MYNTRSLWYIYIYTHMYICIYITHHTHVVTHCKHTEIKLQAHIIKHAHRCTEGKAWSVLICEQQMPITDDTSDSIVAENSRVGGGQWGDNFLNNILGIITIVRDSYIAGFICIRHSIQSFGLTYEPLHWVKDKFIVLKLIIQVGFLSME